MENLESRFLTARKEYIASQFRKLNPMQQQAVMTTQGPLLLLAGAGSGKTTVLINRIANLIRFGCGSDSNDVPEGITQEDVAFLEFFPEEPTEQETRRADRLCALEPAAPWSIMAITFTNKAANELKERLSALLGPEAQDIWAMTFHSACCRILRRDIERMGYTRSFTIYDSSDSERIMKEIIKDMGLDDKTFPAKYVLGAISKETHFVDTGASHISIGYDGCAFFQSFQSFCNYAFRKKHGTCIIKVCRSMNNTFYNIQLFFVNVNLSQFFANNFHTAFFNIRRQYIL